MKKKLLAIALCAVMGLSLAACGNSANNKPDADKKPDTENVVEPSNTGNDNLIGGDSNTWGSALGGNSDENKVEIPNPWKIFDTMEEAKDSAGFEVSVPESMDGYSTKTIRVNTILDSKVIEVIYNDDGEDGNEIRIRKAPGMEDISGDYNTYEQTNTVSVGGLHVTMKGNSDMVNLAIWTDDSYTYSISVSAGLSSEDMTEMVSNIQ